MNKNWFRVKMREKREAEEAAAEVQAALEPLPNSGFPPELEPPKEG